MNILFARARAETQRGNLLKLNSKELREFFCILKGAKLKGNKKSPLGEFQNT